MRDRELCLQLYQHIIYSTVIPAFRVWFIE